jgi:hypothetical protein
MELIFALLLSLATATTCGDLFMLTTESQALDHFKGAPRAVNEDCILASIDKNWWDLAYTLGDWALENNLKLTNTVRNKATSKKK